MKNKDYYVNKINLTDEINDFKDKVNYLLEIKKDIFETSILDIDLDLLEQPFTSSYYNNNNCSSIISKFNKKRAQLLTEIYANEKIRVYKYSKYKKLLKPNINPNLSSYLFSNLKDSDLDRLNITLDLISNSEIDSDRFVLIHSNLDLFIYSFIFINLSFNFSSNIDFKDLVSKTIKVRYVSNTNRNWNLIDYADEINKIVKDKDGSKINELIRSGGNIPKLDDLLYDLFLNKSINVKYLDEINIKKLKIIMKSYLFESYFRNESNYYYNRYNRLSDKQKYILEEIKKIVLC